MRKNLSNSMKLTTLGKKRNEVLGLLNGEKLKFYGHSDPIICSGAALSNQTTCPVSQNVENLKLIHVVQISTESLLDQCIGEWYVIYSHVPQVIQGFRHELGDRFVAASGPKFSSH
ncbi:hypothetical protein IV203_037247 [Nitzschia inconspicua]|uniref:Uncharacterized protein n=1 Tax=Nitzschia inconspicua TaxID=303405 RepID=A0A9K3PAP7_9STRA|nr:hypothetical protein IV203_006569 [Nitzschia inconspicua]KAG7364045.1 hypothetical protein IV203_037247 [Nitzschia inconspicua]